MNIGKSTALKFDRETLLQLARQRTGLADFGDCWFFEPMDRFIEAANAEGRLTEAGFQAQTEMIVRGLSNRLRMVEDIRLHPEILDERIDVAAIILGLPRTGSTIFHRLLASAPGMTALRWLEGQNFAPLPGEKRGEIHERQAYARALLDGWLQLSPELISIHPLDPDSPDEEVMLLGQMFVSTMVEAMTFVPSFSRWLDEYDQSRGHEDLKTILRYLQWQDPSRRGKRWILKSPTNLPYAEVAARAFPDALLIMTHRDPLEVVPSYVSLQAAIYKMSASIPDHDVGAFWFPRLVQWMHRFEQARASIGDDRIIDIDYRAVLKDPIGQATRVLNRIGIDTDESTEQGLEEFLAGNRREQRPAHDYSLERFGLDEQKVREAFRSYWPRSDG